MPAGAFGNWIMPMVTAPVDASTASLGMLAAALRKELLSAARNFYNECGWLWQQEQQKAVHKVVPVIVDAAEQDGIVVCTNWDWEQEDAVFGEGCKPVWVQGSGIMHSPNGMIAIKELGEGGGSWVWVCLHKAPMQKLVEVLRQWGWDK